MIAEHPEKLIFIGFLLVLLGFALPVLMVIDVVKATLFLSFLAHGASTSGLFLGLMGTMMMRTRYRRDASLRDGFPSPAQRRKSTLSRLFRLSSGSDDTLRKKHQVDDA